MTKRFSAVALIVLLTIVATAPVRAAGSEDDLAAVKVRIASLEQQIQATSGRRSGIAQEVLAAAARLESAEADVETAQSNVDALRDELALRQDVLTGIRRELASRLIELASTRSNRDDARSEAEASVVHAYMRGGVGEPSIAFAASGVAQISVGLSYLEALTGNSADAADRYGVILIQEEQDRARIRQLEGSIAVEVQELGDSEHEAEAQAADLAIKRAAVKNEYQNQTALLARVDAQIEEFEHVKESFEKEEASIRATIAAATAAAKAKAEAEAGARARATARAEAEASAASATTRPPITNASTVTTAPASTGTGALRWPIRGSIDSPFGWRIHPITWTKRLHTGIDIDGWYGQEIKAAKAGIVILAGVKGGYGNSVMIDHQNGWVTLYAHQQSLNVQVGQYVTTATTIGWVGSTGDSTGPHLHFELRVNGIPTDPMRYL
jgi:murein DD-endopeptidase MepM/ murein hydrolase activator NlpD